MGYSVLERAGIVKEKPKDIYKVLRLRVKEVAQQKKLSMNKLSQRSEVSYNIIRDIYRDPFKTVNTDTINRIAAALEVPVTEIIEDVPSPVNK